MGEELSRAPQLLGTLCCPQTRLSCQQRFLCTVSLEAEPQTPGRSPRGLIVTRKMEPLGTMRTQWYRESPVLSLANQAGTSVPPPPSTSTFHWACGP